MPVQEDRRRALETLRAHPVGDIHFGRAPDGLPWVLSIDRAARIEQLHDAICHVFGISGLSELPPHLADVVREDLSQGLTGFHDVDLGDGRGPQTTYTTVRSSGSLMGPTLLSHILGRSGHTRLAMSTQLIVPGTAVTGAAKSVADALAERRTSRRLIIPVDDERIWIGGVKQADRAFRRPSGPFRELVFESLSDWRGARVRMPHEHRPIDIVDADVLPALARQSRAAYDLDRRIFEVPHATIVDVVIDVANALHEVHATGVLHGDLSPANILLSNGRPLLIDALDVPIGSRSAFATYDWASPEQVLGRVVDQRSEVFVLGKLLATALEGVAYGQNVSFTIPIGGRGLQTVSTTLVEGVFIDATDRDISPDWQESWCAFLSRCMDANPDKRPRSAAELGSEAAELAQRHPPNGWARFVASFGAIQAADTGPWDMPFHLLRD